MENRIAQERALAYDYYYGRPFGNEMEGRSQVISADVAQAVDAALPDIMEVFVGSDQAVEFSPRNAEDVPAAEQATIGANYVFFTQNNGYALAHDFLKDGLLQKTGAFKWTWDTSIVMSEKRYVGLDDGTFQVLGDDPDVEIVAHSEYQDPDWQMPQMQPMGQPMQPPMLHDCIARARKEAGRIKIIVPPPEEILISPDAMTLDVMAMPFIAHTPLLTASDLRQMGIPDNIIAQLPKGDENPLEQERIARKDRVDANATLLDEGDSTQDDVYRYNECYLRLDVDGDGIAELRKVCMVGDTVLHNEPVDHIPIAIWTPKVMPHEVVGISLADDVMDLQLLKSTIWRMTMDSWYQSVFPRLVVQGDVNMDDVLTLKPGAPIRTEPGAEVTPIAVPFTGQTGPQMLEYADQEKDNRIGFSAMGPGLDPESINKTATYVRQMTQQTNSRAKIIARNAAEFGFKPLFKGIAYLLAKHQQKPLIVRLTNKFVPIDPETWSKEYDMTCNVGLGIGSKEQQLMHLQALGGDLQAIAGTPFAPLLLDAMKIYNYVEKKANLAGFKDVSVFLNKPIDPQTGGVAQPPQQPNPMIQAEQIKAQAQAQAAQVKAQADREIESARAQADMQVQNVKIQTQAQLEMERTKQQLLLEDVKHSREQDNAYRIAQLNNETKIVVAQITAKQQADAAAAAADAETAKDLGA